MQIQRYLNINSINIVISLICLRIYITENENKRNVIVVDVVEKSKKMN